MSILLWLLLGIATYFFLIFFLLRLVVPFMGFTKPKLPREIPQEITDVITAMEAKSQSQREYSAAAYKLVTSRWYAGRMSTLYYAPLAFRTELPILWSETGFAHCNTQNYILYILLARSRFFRPEDVTVKTVFFNFFIHQYLKVKIDTTWTDLDPAGAAIRGMPLGTHISFFG